MKKLRKKYRYPEYRKEYQGGIKYKRYQKSYRDDHKKEQKKYRELWRKTASGRYCEYKASAKQKGHIFDLTLKEFETILEKPCYYCNGDSYGLDRVDSSIGYLKDNIVSCCSRCNQMKNNMSIEEFIERCRKILDNYK